jgi:glucose-1-phosphate cytidylyltransferase
MNEINQVVILAGGKGTRMREMTEDLPKPMVTVGGIPVLEHLINIFEKHKKFKFIVCTGYLENVIFDYFSDWDNVEVLSTGDETNTGGRLFKARELLDENFIITYGDGLANVNIIDLINFHFNHKKIGTITVTNPVSRFGLVNFNNSNEVTEFVEKPKLEGFVNIGFMAFKKKFIEYLDDGSTLEIDPLINLTKINELNAFIHNGYFEPMDTYREYLNMNKLWDDGNPPWTI